MRLEDIETIIPEDLFIIATFEVELPTTTTTTTEEPPEEPTLDTE